MHPVFDQPIVGAANAPDVVIAVASAAGSSLAWALLCGGASIVAIVRVVRKPAEEWNHRLWSKLAWVVAVACLTPTIAGVPIPVGTIAALWPTRAASRPHAGAGQLPPADGSRWPFPGSGK